MDQNMQQWLTRVDVNVSDNTKIFARYNLQSRDAEFPGRPLVAQRQPGALPDRRHRAQQVALVNGQPHACVRTDADERVHVRDDVHQLPEPVRGSQPRVARALGYTNPGIYRSGLDQMPSMTAWGNGPTMFNPGGFDPVLFADKWLISGAQNVTKVAGAHTMKAGALLRVGEQRAAGQRRFERPSDSGVVGDEHERQLFRRHAHRHARGVRRAVAEHRPRHGLQHLRAVRAGQLEGEQPADGGRRPAPVAPRAVVRA